MQGPRPVTNVGPPPHSEGHVNIWIYSINNFKNQIFYDVSNADEKPRIVSQESN
jgi:hypothetical protein